MIIECARCVRLHVGFPLQFWANVVDIIVCLINRGTASTLDGGILEEAWTGKKVKYCYGEKLSMAWGVPQQKSRH